MFLKIDLAQLPPAMVLREPENVRELRAVVVSVGHGYIAEPELRRMVESAAGGSLPEGYEAMIAYAAEHGWRREDGAIRVHVEPAPDR